MALPSRGTLGQKVEYNGYIYQWTGVGWNNIGISSITIGNTTIGANSITVGNSTIGSNSISVGNTTVGANGITANSINVGNTTIGSNGITANSINVGNTTIGSNGITANSINVGNTTIGSNGITANSINVGNTSIGANGITSNSINLVGGSGNTSIGSNGVNVGNTNIGSNGISIGNSTSNVAISSNSIGVGDVNISTNSISIGGGTLTATAYSGTANNTLYVGAVTAINIVSNNQLQANLARYQTTAGLAANVALLAANNANYLNGNSAADLLAYSDTAYTNAVSYVNGRITDVGSDITGNSATAYTNAVSFASNATNISSGTLSEPRLPYRMNQDLRTTDSVTFENLVISGDITLGGAAYNVTTYNSVIQDSLINLHTPADLSPLSSNDGKNIGFVFHYYNVTDKHAYLIRDNVTGRLVYYDTGTDPLTVPNPVGGALGTIQADAFHIGNNSVYATINATSYTGSANSSSYLNGNTAATLISYSNNAYTNAVSYVDGKAFVNTNQLSTNLSNYQTTLGLAANVAKLDANNAAYLGGVAAANYPNTSGDFTITGIYTYNSGFVINSAIIAGGTAGNPGEVLSSNGITGDVYWANVAAAAAAGGIELDGGSF